MIQELRHFNAIHFVGKDARLQNAKAGDYAVCLQWEALNVTSKTLPDYGFDSIGLCLRALVPKWPVQSLAFWHGRGVGRYGEEDLDDPSCRKITLQCPIVFLKDEQPPTICAVHLQGVPTWLANMKFQTE